MACCFNCVSGLKLPKKFSRGFHFVGDMQIHYITNLHAPLVTGIPLVELHMNPRSVDEYLEVNEDLLAADPTMPILAIDIIGYGASNDPTAPVTIAEIASHVLGVVDALHIAQFDLLGSMLGSYASVEIAAEHPERVRNVMLNGLEFFDSASLPAFAGWVKSKARWHVNATGAHLEASWLSRPWNTPELHERVTLDDLRAAPVEAHNSPLTLLPAYFAQNYTSQLKRVAASGLPVQLIYGTAWIALFDMYGFNVSGAIPHLQQLLALDKSAITYVQGGTLQIMNQNATQVVEVIQKARQN